MERKIFINLKEVADIIGISVSTLYKLCSSGKINPECGKKYGRQWLFVREMVIKNKLLK
ncbi:MAG: helix-turn-helix domain-containing protein [Candidatus Omnitrophica bacterium]|nr:helix-turn-helix domain-containing protein [Candidatus Omnitrophota bacterium]